MRLIDLLEGTREKIRSDITNALPPTNIIPVENSDSYRQYRYNVALAAARAMDEEHIDTMKPEGPFGEFQTVVCYTAEDSETVDLANRIFGYKSIKIASTKSSEPSYVNKSSPVRQFKNYD